MIMPATPIRAVDERIMPFTPAQIWSVLADVTASPRWWPASISVKVIQATPGLIGSEMDICPRGGRPFRCHVEAVEPPRFMAMSYPGNFISGTGEWRLESLNSGGTRATYAIDVVAKGWLAALVGRVVPLARVHSKAMQDILAALEKETARQCGGGSSD